MTKPLLLFVLGALSLSSGCNGPFILSGEYVNDSSTEWIDVDSHATGFTVAFDRGSTHKGKAVVEFQNDVDRTRGLAVVGQRVMVDNYVIGGPIPCIVTEGRARFRKESLKRQRFQFSFECYREGHPSEIMQFGFEGQRN